MDFPQKQKPIVRKIEITNEEEAKKAVAVLDAKLKEYNTYLNNCNNWIKYMNKEKRRISDLYNLK